MHELKQNDGLASDNGIVESKRRLVCYATEKNEKQRIRQWNPSYIFAALCINVPAT